MASEEKAPLLGSGRRASGINDATPWYAKYPYLYWLYEHRQHIPGYGIWKLFRQASAYMLYVLLIMLFVYLLNQLDRYTISITAKYVGQDLGFGDLDCMPNISVIKDYHLSRKFFVDTLMVECNKNTTIKHNQPLCLEYEYDIETENDSIPVPICVWDHDGATGIEYETLAGPVFNNVYPLAGIVMGFLADRYNRKIMLGLSLFFWSVATGVTGFAQHYWMLVVFRMLLAIGAAGCSPIAVSIIAAYFPQDLRGTALGIYYWGIYTGYSLAYALDNKINIVLNWRWVFFISGLLGIALTPFVLFTIKEPKREQENDHKDGLLRKEKESTVIAQLKELWQKIKLITKTFFMPGMFLLCIGGGIRNAGGYVWAYNARPFFSLKYTGDVNSAYVSVIPVVAGSIGAVVGGLISDLLVKNRGPYARIWVLIVSQILAAPFVALALFLPSFLTLITSKFLGEMWVGVLSAIVIDISPTKIRTSVIAIYLFIITVIGGNFNVLVPPLEKGFKHHTNKYDATKWAIFLTSPCLYVLSSIIFILAFFLIRIDIKVKKKRDAALSLNRPRSIDSIES